ncbi:MAG: glycoside hydrolase family 9 protein, partial [Spirochaeta sp.]
MSRLTLPPLIFRYGTICAAALLLLSSCATPAQTPNPKEHTIVPGSQVFVNQTGYHPLFPKMAVVTARGRDFSVVNIHTEEAVFTGNLNEPQSDPMSGFTVQQADFTDVTEPGTYIILVDGTAASLPFKIDEGVYHDPLLKTMRSYTLQRSGLDIRDALSGLQLDAGHLQDREAIIYYSDDVVSEGDTIDVHGGWYDAGDFGRYIPPSAVTVAQLLLAYENNRDSFYTGQLAFPPGFESEEEPLPDFLKEIRYNVDWMLRMQRPDGAVFHKVSGAGWPGWVTPDQDVQDRYVYGVSSFGTAQFAGTMALASRIYREFDEEYADQLLNAAEAAIDHLMQNPTAYFRFDDDQDAGSGPYAKDTDDEERLWAAAEMLRTTGDSAYNDYILANLSHTFEENQLDFISWGNTIALGYWAYIQAEDGADQEIQDSIRSYFTDTADSIIDIVAADGFNIALEEDEYTWASAKNTVAKGNLLIQAYSIDPNPEYLHGALDQLHYVLGRSPTGYSYVTGTGVISPQHPHHRTSEATGIVVPGLLVGGPNIFGGDPLLEAFIENEDPAPAQAYLDTLQSWATNEYAIDYTAPAVYALSFFNYFDDSGYMLQEESDEGGNDDEESAARIITPGDTIADYSDLTEDWSTFTDGGSIIQISHSQDPDGRSALRIEHDLKQHGWLGATYTGNQDWTAIGGIRFPIRGEEGQEYRLEVTNYDNGLHELRFTLETDDWQIMEVRFSDLAVRK